MGGDGVEIEIRDARPEDAAAVHEILVSPHVIHSTMRLPFQTLQQTEKRIAPVDGVFKLVAVSAGAVVGFCELVTYPEIPRHRHVGDVNIIVTVEGWQGKGVGRALMEATIDLADNWLGLKRMGLIVWTDNDRAIGLYESLGFVVEGTMPAYAFREGAYVEARMMGRVKL